MVYCDSYELIGYIIVGGQSRLIDWLVLFHLPLTNYGHFGEMGSPGPDVLCSKGKEVSFPRSEVLF